MAKETYYDSDGDRLLTIDNSKQLEEELWKVICRLIEQWEKLSKRNFEKTYYNMLRGN